MPIYMKIAEIPGEVAAEGHKNEIAIGSFQFGVGIGVEAPTAGSGTGKRSTSAASFSEAVVSKTLDNSSGKFMETLASGTSLPKVEIFFVLATGKDKTGDDTYMTITLEDVFVSGYSLSSGGDMPTESVSLNYAKVKKNYMKSDSAGNLTQGTIAGWDIAGNKAYA
jgi:type VI secretion system secreted protein Hcp